MIEPEKYEEVYARIAEDMAYQITDIIEGGDRQ